MWDSPEPGAQFCITCENYFYLLLLLWLLLLVFICLFIITIINTIIAIIVIMIIVSGLTCLLLLCMACTNIFLLQHKERPTCLQMLHKGSEVKPSAWQHVQ